jgi:hypothetical protein
MQGGLLWRWGPMSDTPVITSPIQKALLVLGSVTLVLLIVCAGELYCRWFTRINFLGISRGMYVAHAYGDSYGNRPDHRGTAFGVEVQTDSNGFRIDPTFRSPASGDAILILGDSVAFGAGVDPSKTVAGLLQRALPSSRVYNSSVIGYGLHDYANVVSHFLPGKPEIKHAILFYCLNDIYDTSAEQIVQEVNETGPKLNPFSSFQAFAVSANGYFRSHSKLYLYLKNVLTDPAMRYFKQDLSEYQRRVTHLDDVLRPLREIADELAAKDVTFEVFVMPYAAQLRTKEEGTLLPQQLVDAFLHKNGIAYYDTADAFLKSNVPRSDLYLYGDPMHLSEVGHRLSFEFVRSELTKNAR